MMDDPLRAARSAGYDLDDGKKPLPSTECTLGLEACGDCQQQCQRRRETHPETDERRAA